MLRHIITVLALTMEGRHLTISQWKESQMYHSIILDSSSSSHRRLRIICLWALMLTIQWQIWTTRSISNSRRTLETLDRTRNTWKLLVPVIALYHLCLSLRIGSKGSQIRIRRILTLITQSLRLAGLRTPIKEWCTLNSNRRLMLTSIRQTQTLDRWLIYTSLIQCTILDQAAVYRADQWVVDLLWETTNISDIHQRTQLQ